MIQKYLNPLLARLAAHRQALVYTPIYFLLSFTDLILKLRHTSSWQNGTLVENHTALMAFQYYNNEQSRVLQFLVPEALRRLFDLSIITSYAVARLGFVFLAFLAFHYFLRKWFSEVEAFAAVMVLSASMFVGFLIQDLQESAPLLMLMFILGLWAMYAKKDLLFCLILLVGGGLTNETMLVMPVGYFLYRVQSWRPLHLLGTGLRTVLLAAPAFLAQGTLRYITRFQPHLGGDWWQWPANTNGIWRELTDPYYAIFHGKYIYLFLSFSIFWLLAILGYSKSPRFFKSVFWIAPFFVVGNLVTGKIEEARQMVPLGFILIPIGLFFMIRERREAAPG